MSKQRLFTENDHGSRILHTYKTGIITNNFSDYSNQSRPTYCMLIKHEWPIREGNTATVYQTQSHQASLYVYSRHQSNLQFPTNTLILRVIVVII